MNNLKEKREKLGKTLREVAEACGTTKNYLWQLEQMLSPNIGLWLAMCLADELETDVYELFGKPFDPIKYQCKLIKQAQERRK